MTLDATLPTDAALTSTYAALLRETRVQVNANIAASALATKTAVTINGANTLIVGDGSGGTLLDVPIEIIFATATGSETLNNVTNAVDGSIKIFWVISGSLTFADDDTKFSNNGDADFDAGTGDVIAYVNNGGDGAGTDGYWHELFRTVRT